MWKLQRCEIVFFHLHFCAIPAERTQCGKLFFFKSQLVVLLFCSETLFSGREDALRWTIFVHAILPDNIYRKKSWAMSSESLPSAQKTSYQDFFIFIFKVFLWIPLISVVLFTFLVKFLPIMLKLCCNCYQKVIKEGFWTVWSDFSGWILG